MLSFAEISGLLDLPPLRTADRTVLHRHGEVPGRDYLGPRTVTLTIEIQADTDHQFAQALDSVAGAFSPTLPDAPFTFRFPGVAGGGVRFVTARVRRRSAPIDVAYAHRLAHVTVELYCAQPMIFDPVTLTAAVTLPNADAPAGGVAMPWRFPVRFGTPANLGVIRVDNAGNFATYPRFRISGPVVDPQIINLSDGSQITFRCVLLAGAWLDIDCFTHQVLLNSVAPRFLTPGLEDAWPECLPGTTEFAFRGFRLDAGPAGDGAELSCSWASAWV
ncbi:hypothetical protein JOD54_001099 [Actinokineospora baliensis]|uniref:phage tail domain-containing protein n=1 Tax=Actinokineospora baliensis TaxID=547056 RepID=UPI00195B1749|nr:phage tail domain-containing protein [Actinokineospora baliensis]MBM7770895.1 hypothetical protein [Actinokineospora baliensis]